MIWKRKRGLNQPILSRWRYRILHDVDPDPFSSGVATGGGGGGGGSSVTTPAPAAPVESAEVPPQTGNINQVDPASRPDFNQPAEVGGQGGGGAENLPADPNQRAGVVAPPTQAGDGWQSIRDAASALGYQVPQGIADDRAFLGHLIRQASANSQADYYARLGRAIAPQAGAIQQYLQQQQQPQQPQGRPAWEAPEFDERWLGLVDRDPATGLFVAKQGAPAEIAQKVNEFVQWKSNYDRNPAAVINGMVESRAKEIAASTFQEQFAAARRDQAIQQIVSDNSRWLYQYDQSGRPVVDPITQQRSYSPLGAAYLQQLQVVRGMGVTDPVHQDRLAKDLVRGQLALAQQTQQQNANGQRVDPQTQQAGIRPNVNQNQTLPPNQRRNTPGTTEPTTTGKSLHEMLREELAAEGVTDADILASVSS